MRRVLWLGLIMLMVLLPLGCAKQQAQPEQASETEKSGVSDQESEEKYPSRTIEYVIGWGAGGGSDLFARTVNMYVRKKLGVPIVEVNMPGASSGKACNYVQSQPADGYTLYSISTELLTNPLLGITEYTFEDFIPIIRAHVDVSGLIVKSDKFKDWNDFLEKAKSGTLTLGGCGAASSDEVALTMLAQDAGFTFKYISYESAGEMQAAVLGGHIDGMYDEMSVVMSLIQEGQLKPIIVFSTEHLEVFPQSVCLGDFGWRQTPLTWRGVAVKKGTPPDRVKLLEEAYLEALDSDVYKSFERDRFLNLIPGRLGSEEFYEVLKEEAAMYKQVYEALGYIKK